MSLKLERTKRQYFKRVRQRPANAPPELLTGQGPFARYTPPKGLRGLWHRFRAALATVTAYPVSDTNYDGVQRPLYTSGTEIDKTWGELYQDQIDAAELWEEHPYATRIIEITTAYVIGSGVSLETDNEQLAKFIDTFWNHDKNDMDDRLSDLADELWRAGELFLSFHPNKHVPEWYIRPLPACTIEGVVWQPGDYENELFYVQTPPETADEPIKWYTPAGIRMLLEEDGEMDKTRPFCLHFTINKRVGAIRGLSDLAFVSDWLIYYKTWLEDRVRLNAAIRFFLIWFKVRRGQAQRIRERYQKQPDPGTVVVEEDGVEMNAVAPNLNARDSAADGVQLRYKFVAGTRGLSLSDFGETDDSNLATAKATAENRRRFMLRRQVKFATILRAAIVECYNRSVEVGMIAGEKVSRKDIKVVRPDISTTDNELIASAAKDLMNMMAEGVGVFGITEEYKRMCLELLMRYTETELTMEQIDAILAGDPIADTLAMLPPMPEDGENGNGDGNG